jgi:anti-anti-sigma factor
VSDNATLPASDDVKDLLEQATRHEVLPVTRLGDTLIVAPAGDLNGYSRKNVEAELSRVQSLLKGRGIANLILDLGHAPYFGSEMIGMFVALRKRVAADGAVVFCEPSSDMRMILDKMRITTLIPMYDTRDAAVQAVVKTTWKDHLNSLRKPLLAVAILALIALAAWLLARTTLFSRWVGTAESRTYSKTVELYHEVLDLSQHHPTAKQWKPVSSRIDESLFPVVERLGEDKSGGRAHKALTKAVQQFWSGTRSTTFPSEAALTNMRKELETARVAIEQESGLKLPAPRVMPDPKAPAPKKSPQEQKLSPDKAE